MLRSRAFTPGFKLFSGISVFALVAAFLAGIGGELGGPEGVSANLDDKGIVNAIVGPLSLGWKGGVGDHLAYTFFVTVAVVAGVLAGISVAFRDADPEAEAELIAVESVPLTKAPNGTSYLPLAAAFGLALLAVGWVADRLLLLGGFAVLAGVIVAWTIRAWAERATGDDTVNRELYDRLVAPVRVPIMAALVVGLIAFGLSRLLLSLSEMGAVVAFSVLGIVVFAVIVAVATRPKITRGLATGVLVLGAVVVLFAGVVGIARGPEDHSKGHGGEKHSGESKEAPAEPATGEN